MRIVLCLMRKTAKPFLKLHVHVDRDNLSAKFWLKPVQLARNIGFSQKDLRTIEKMIVAHRQELQERWDGYFRLLDVASGI
ncbi:MAG: hypothetical protein DSY70_06465 [Desulfobulbus sp.]|nr:MAG: hypothetical protein DSY70_06465 [Desulfobulbus sp.]